MQIRERKQGAVIVLKPEGPLAGNDAEEFKSRLVQAQRDSLGRFVLDAARIPLVDSKGLEALVEVTEEMAQSGKALKVCAANETLRQVLDLTGLSPLFEHFEDVNAAVRSFL
jgi:anti-anti-sigma factor